MTTAAAAQRAAADLLVALGMDLEDQVGTDTPRGMAHALPGRLRDDPQLRSEFLAVARKR